MPHLQLFVSCLELVELCGNWQKSYPKQDFSLWLKFQDAPKTPQRLCAIQSRQQEIWGLLKFVLFWHGSSAPCSLCIKCHDALDWKVGNIINAINAVRLWSCCHEKSVCGFFPPPGFQHQQNPSNRRGSASPCHCYPSPKIKVTITLLFPWGSWNKLMKCFTGNNSVRRKLLTNQPTNQKD